jgi:chaperone modulatory protein CbpM
MNSVEKDVYTLAEILDEMNLDEKKVIYFIERNWITPVELSSKFFDEQDLRRLKFILELQNDFEVNDEGVDLILHLIDQLNSIQNIAAKLK